MSTMNADQLIVPTEEEARRLSGSSIGYGKYQQAWLRGARGLPSEVDPNGNTPIEDFTPEDLSYRRAYLMGKMGVVGTSISKYEEHREALAQA